MLRVQATLQKSVYASSFDSQIKDLKSWVKQILDGTFKAIVGGSFSSSLSNANIVI